MGMDSRLNFGVYFFVDIWPPLLEEWEATIHQIHRHTQISGWEIRSQIPQCKGISLNEWIPWKFSALCKHLGSNCSESNSRKGSRMVSSFSVLVLRRLRDHPWHWWEVSLVFKARTSAWNWLPLRSLLYLRCINRIIAIAAIWIQRKIVISNHRTPTKTQPYRPWNCWQLMRAEMAAEIAAIESLWASKPGWFKPGRVQFLCRDALLRSFS